MRNQPTPLEVVGVCALAGACCASAYLAWRSGTYLALVVMVPLSLLFLWGVVDTLRQGVRRPTTFERFEAGLLIRFVLIVAGGGAVVALVYRAGHSDAALGLLVMVLVAGLLSASRLRSNHETSAGYKRRVGYRDPAQREDS